MIKKCLLVVTAFVAMGLGFLFAQEVAPMGTQKAEHMRIFELKDRIKGQRDRIDEALVEKTITLSQAQGCRDVLNIVEQQIKDEAKANGTKKAMRREQYEAYNTALDVNSAFVHEQKQSYYYYKPYYEQHWFWN